MLQKIGTFFVFARAEFRKIEGSLFGNKTKVLCLNLPYVKRYFQELQWSAFLLMAQITQILLFSWMWLLERSKITVWERNLVKKKFNYGSFVVMSTLRKKVFSGAPFKYFFLYGSSNSNSVVFGNASLAEINDHSLRATSFQIKILQ